MLTPLPLCGLGGTELTPTLTPLNGMQDAEPPLPPHTAARHADTYYDGSPGGAASATATAATATAARKAAASRQEWVD